ncbi:hypothetical protein MHU86_19159 [Fragilaria crotonensis]|nr:hypothetical protein MHU86_19159 [Fragilaria crotonensis]
MVAKTARSGTFDEVLEPSAQRTGKSIITGLCYCPSQTTPWLLNISLVDDEGNDMPKVKAKWKESIAVLKKIRNSAFDYRAEHLHSNLAMYQALEPQETPISLQIKEKFDAYFSS